MAKGKQSQDAGVATMEPQDEPGVKSGDDLLGHLEGTGTPLATLQPYRDMARAITAERLYREMEVNLVTEGTLRKAGKWIWGPTFEPNQVVQTSTDDEVLRLRQQLEQLQARVAGLMTERNAAHHRENFLQEKITEQAKQINFLRAGRSKKDLAALDAGQQG